LTCDLNGLIRTLVENRDALNSRSEQPVEFLPVVTADGGSVWLRVDVGAVAEPFARMEPDTAESRTPAYR
jgi:hypothetical protein